jgi:hypothetical protein
VISLLPSFSLLPYAANMLEKNKPSTKNNSTNTRKRRREVIENENQDKLANPRLSSGSVQKQPNPRTPLIDIKNIVATQNLNSGQSSFTNIPTSIFEPLTHESIVSNSFNSFPFDQYP